jgi:RecB family exonuclease
VDARPPSLSVTQIETLVRDPYAVYACKVLGLRPLDPLGRAPDVMERGSAIHAALEAFVRATEAGLPADAREVFARETAAALALAAPWPAVRACWAARLERSGEWFLAGEAERRVRAAPFAREASGRRELDGLPRPFAVTAKADRIDRCGDGRYAIYDYKSGSVPSEAEARAFHLQLPLEAAIAQAGGFAGLPPGEVAHLELIGLGRRQSRPIPADRGAVAETWDKLRRLIAAYQVPAAGFAARLRPQKLSHAGDYDHLSRLGEWADGDPLEPEDVA